MKIKSTFVLFFIGLLCFGQNSKDSIAVEKKKQRTERILSAMNKRKEEADTKLGRRKKVVPVDSIRVNDKAIFDGVFSNVNDTLKTN